MIQKCALLDRYSRNKRFSPLKKHMHRRYMPPHQRMCTNGLDQPAHTHQAQIGTLSCQCFQLPTYTEKLWICNHQWFYSFHLQASTMDASQYWSFACEYSIWNSTVAALQFWTADIEPHILSNAIDQVYTAFFYSDFTHQIWNLPEEILFGHFVTTLNDASETELAKENKGYESGSESFNIPTPLSRALRTYHVSTGEELSFYPTNFDQSPTTPEQHEENSPHRYRHCSLTHCLLVFTSSDDESAVRPQPSSTDTSSPAHRSAAFSSAEHNNQHHHCIYTQNMEQFYTDFDIMLHVDGWWYNFHWGTLPKSTIA